MSCPHLGSLKIAAELVEAMTYTFRSSSVPTKKPGCATTREPGFMKRGPTPRKWKVWIAGSSQHRKELCQNVHKHSVVKRVLFGGARARWGGARDFGLRVPRGTAIGCRMEQVKNPSAVALGRRGGKVTGVCKRRSPEHYKMLAKLGVAARIKANRLAAKLAAGK